MDLLVVAFGVGVSSIFGLPFTVASVVLSINHLRMLTVKKTAGDFIGGTDTVK